MLSYRHSFHAGNFADVIKHICLINILDYLTQKDKPLCYIDTHSGGGAYSLQSASAQKNREYLNGVGKLWPADHLPAPVHRYIELVGRLNSTADLLSYPGSPWIAQQLLRPSDRLFLCELHNSEVPLLRDLVQRDRRVHVRHEDGLKFCLSLLPPKEKRALVLIDPSYELDKDYQRVAETLIQAYKRFATGCYALWYPVVDRRRIDRLEDNLRRSGIRNILLLELGVAPDCGKGMTASGMIIINPPWQLADTMKSVLPFLAQQLAVESGSFRNEWLAQEC